MKFILAITIVFLFSQPSWSAITGEKRLKNVSSGLNYYYEGNELRRHWSILHSNDSIPWPSSESVKNQLTPFLANIVDNTALPDNFNGNFGEVANSLQEAWRLFHAGQYQASYKLSSTLGVAGLIPKLRSLAIYHHYFESDKKQRKKTFAALIREIDSLQKRYHLEDPAIYLLKAFAIGRYGQEINPISAFAKGLGGKLKRNIYRAAELAPENSEALMFKAVFDAEAIRYAGGVTSKMLYGASKKRSLDNFERALSRSPKNTALLLEFGKACLHICKKKQRSKGYELLQNLVRMKPTDLGDVQNKKMAQEVLEKQLARHKLDTSSKQNQYQAG